MEIEITKIALGIIGGLGLFIYGMHVLSDALRNLSLSLLRNLLEKISSNSARSVIVGIAVTAVIQSSSATSVLLIGFLNAGFLALPAAFAIMLGAHVGTTVTAQLVAFKLTAVAPLFVFIGALIFFFAKKDKNKNKGLAILGFGLLFMGLSMMSAAVKPLSQNEVARNAFLTFGSHPFLGILTGLLVTAILQSSSTVTGMIIAFASAGLLDLPSSIYLVFGTNIGTSVTAIIASIGGNLSSKRLAMGNTLSTVVGTLINLPLVPLYLMLIPLLPGDLPRQVANTHTIFNVINTLLFIPAIPLFIKILDRIIPGKDYEKREAHHLDPNLLTTPHLAIMAIVKELSVMLGICQEMLGKARKCVVSYNHKLKNEMTFDEDSVDEIQKNITEYLVEITKSEMLEEKQRRLVPSLLHSVNDIEKVGDYCENIGILAQRLYEHNLQFSSEANEELEKLFDKTHILMHQTKKALNNDDHKAATITLNVQAEINDLITQYRLNHIKRLEKGSCFSNSGLVYSDILTDIERMNAHLCNITKGILHIGKR